MIYTDQVAWTRAYEAWVVEKAKAVIDGQEQATFFMYNTAR